MPDANEKARHEAHLRAAAQHDLAACAHRTAAEHNEKGDDAGESRHSQRAMEYSDHAYKPAKEARSKSVRRWRLFDLCPNVTTTDHTTRNTGAPRNCTRAQHMPMMSPSNTGNRFT